MAKKEAAEVKEGKTWAELTSECRAFAACWKIPALFTHQLDHGPARLYLTLTFSGEVSTQGAETSS